MFTSSRREIVFPQREHARLSATIAHCWGNERFLLPPFAHNSLVLGVLSHDRCYPDLDTSPVPNPNLEEWLHVQSRNLELQLDDPIAEVLVLLHCKRLLEHRRLPECDALATRLGDKLSGLLDPATLTNVMLADQITNLCDSIAFAFCLEKRSRGTVEMQTSEGSMVEVEYALDGKSLITIEPWPLAVPQLSSFIVGYHREKYPTLLRPLLVPYTIQPT